MELGFSSRLKSWLLLADPSGSVIDGLSKTVTVARTKSANSTSYEFDAVICQGQRGTEFKEKLVSIAQCIKSVGVKRVSLLLLGDYRSDPTLSAVQTVVEGLELPESEAAHRVELSCFQAYDNAVFDLLVERAQSAAPLRLREHRTRGTVVDG